MSIKTLITADDFGFTANINRAIREAYKKSRITELSVMVDSYGTDEAVKYIRENNVQNVGLHFSLLRVSKGIKILRNKDYDEILENRTKDQLTKAFDEEVKIFEQKVGFKPKHIIGHKQIALHPKLVEYIGNYCVKNNCYARSNVAHKTLQTAVIPKGFNIGRTADEKFTFRYGTPEEMYHQYKKDILGAKQKHGFKSAEFIFHPGYAGKFEKGLTSFIQERIDDINFLLSDYFLRLIKEENFQLVSSSEI